MIKVYRACSYKELETLLKTGKIEGFHDQTGGISCSLNYNFTLEIANNTRFNWKLVQDKIDKQSSQSFIVVMDYDKLNNPIDIQYDLEWLRARPDVYEHVFGCDDEYADEYSSGEDDTEILGTKDELLEILVDGYAQEQEILVFNHRMVDGMILAIGGIDFHLVSEIAKLYKKCGYKSYVSFSKIEE
jgi:hypothetical protein